MDKERLKGKNVLITGAAQGMGAAVGEHFAAQGAKICLTDVNLDGCKEVEERIRSAGGEAISCKVDVRNREDNVAAVKATVENFGSLNVSINNAGVNKPLFFMDITEENYDFIMDINVRGALLGMQEQARQMIKQGKQKEPYKIIHVASILSRETFDDVVVYGMSKHAIAALIKGGAKSLVEHGITVNGYGPGVVRTELWEQLDKDLVAIGKFDKPGESMDSIAENMILMKRYSYPEDVVGTASFLASSESDYMTGQILMIDGGMVIQ